MRIGIVNDTPFAVEAMRRTLLTRPQYQVAWIARNGSEAVTHCARDTPDLVLMDLLMPVMDGVEATRQIMAATPCAILVVTASVSSNATKVFEAMGHGALDAVNTPALGMAGTGPAAAAFFAKIETIGKLIRDRVGSARHLPAAARGGVPGIPGSAALVAIGASAGGPTAIATVLQGLPRDFGAAVVIVQHVDQQFVAGMADWLGERSALPVRLAAQGERVAPGVVLLAAAEDHLKLRPAGVLGYDPEPRDEIYRPSVDVLFDSICENWRGDAAGVLLTGMGRDGAEGLKAMRDKGWYTVTQDQATSAVYGMPKAAAALGAAVDVLPIGAIAGKLKTRFPRR